MKNILFLSFAHLLSISLHIKSTIDCNYILIFISTSTGCNIFLFNSDETMKNLCRKLSLNFVFVKRSKFFLQNGLLELNALQNYF